MSLRVAYLVNQYPKVSHSFIRREILALERQGIEVQRIALRGWDEEVVDEEDREEKARTRYVLQAGSFALGWAVLRTCAAHPRRFTLALWLAVRMSARADRPLPYHLAYLAEACLILRWVRESGARHLHAHFATNPAEVVMLVGALGGPNYSFTVHGTAEFDRFQSLGIAEKVRRASFVVAASSFARGQLYRRVGYSQWPKIQVVHCGLEPAFHAAERARNPDSAIARLICVGRLSEEKGQMLLVQAMQRLVQGGDRVELVLAGDGELRPAIEDQIARSGLGSLVRITGWISSRQVRDEILAARGLVLPSFAEGLPVVLMEAMAVGKPVLAACVGGIPELVCHGVDGWLFPAGSVDAIVDAVRDFLHTPFTRLSEMGSAGRDRALQRHSADAEAAKLAKLFTDAASRRVE